MLTTNAWKDIYCHTVYLKLPDLFLMIGAKSDAWIKLKGWFAFIDIYRHISLLKAQQWRFQTASIATRRMTGKIRFLRSSTKSFPRFSNSFRLVFRVQLPCCERRRQIPRVSRFLHGDPCGSSGESGGIGDSWWRRWQTHSPAFQRPKPRWKQSGPWCLRNTTRDNINRCWDQAKYT